ncbi:MAG: COG1361 S-layer family protein [Nanoarchaeota archaeon]
MAPFVFASDEFESTSSQELSNEPEIMQEDEEYEGDDNQQEQRERLVYGAQVYDTFSGGNVQVSMLNQQPDPVEPGKYVDVRFKVENLGDERVEDIMLEFVPEYPFSKDPGKDKTVNITSLDAYQKEGRSVIVKYTLRVDERAVEGENQVKLKIKEGDLAPTTRIFNINVESKFANLELSSIESTPYPAFPGEEVKVSFEAENLADSAIKNVRFRLGLDTPESVADEGKDLPFAPLRHGTEKEVGLIEPGENVSLNYDLMVSPDASPGIYKIPMEISFYDQRNNEYKKKEMFGVFVNSEPRISVVLDEDEGVRPGQKNELSIRFTNKGLPNLKFLTARITETEQFEVFSPKEKYMGNLDSDFYDIVNYKVYIEPTNESTIKIPIVYEFMDGVNNDYTRSKELEIRVLTPELEERMGLVEEPAQPVFIYVLIAFVVLYILYRFNKKRKQK